MILLRMFVSFFIVYPVLAFLSYQKDSGRGQLCVIRSLHDIFDQPCIFRFLSLCSQILFAQLINMFQLILIFLSQLINPPGRPIPGSPDFMNDMKCVRNSCCMILTQLSRRAWAFSALSSDSSPGPYSAVPAPAKFLLLPAVPALPVPFQQSFFAFCYPAVSEYHMPYSHLGQHSMSAGNDTDVEAGIRDSDPTPSADPLPFRRENVL